MKPSTPENHCHESTCGDSTPENGRSVDQDAFTLDPTPAPRRKPATKPPVTERQRLMPWTQELPGQTHLDD